MQKEVPKGPRKARQSRPGRARAGLGPDPEPSWGHPPSAFAHMPLASAPEGRTFDQCGSSCTGRERVRAGGRGWALSWSEPVARQQNGNSRAAKSGSATNVLWQTRTESQSLFPLEFSHLLMRTA